MLIKTLKKKLPSVKRRRDIDVLGDFVFRNAPRVIKVSSLVSLSLISRISSSLSLYIHIIINALKPLFIVTQSYINTQLFFPICMFYIHSHEIIFANRTEVALLDSIHVTKKREIKWNDCHVF